MCSKFRRTSKLIIHPEKVDRIKPGVMNRIQQDYKVMAWPKEFLSNVLLFEGHPDAVEKAKIFSKSLFEGSKQEYEEIAHQPPPPMSPTDELQTISIDGSNVAWQHGEQEFFSCEGIKVVTEYFHKYNLKVFVSVVRSAVCKFYLPELWKAGNLIFTPAGHNEDVFAVDDSYLNDGVVLSNSKVIWSSRYSELVEIRMLSFLFVEDIFMPTLDPEGRYGPDLDTFLKKTWTVQGISLEEYLSQQPLHTNRGPNSKSILCTPPSRLMSLTAEPQTNLRTISIDGSNVAWKHGRDWFFSWEGIRIATDFFQQRGHPLMVFVSTKKRDPSKTKMEKLCKEGMLVFTPEPHYEDNFVLDYAQKMDGVVLSNDRFRDLRKKRRDWTTMIDTRVLTFVFDDDTFIPNHHPLGHNGPDLDTFLKMPWTVQGSSLQGHTQPLHANQGPSHDSNLLSTPFPPTNLQPISMKSSRQGKGDRPGRECRE